MLSHSNNQRKNSLKSQFLMKIENCTDVSKLLTFVTFACHQRYNADAVRIWSHPTDSSRNKQTIATPVTSKSRLQGNQKIKSKSKRAKANSPCHEQTIARPVSEQVTPNCPVINRTIKSLQKLGWSKYKIETRGIRGNQVDKQKTK